MKKAYNLEYYKLEKESMNQSAELKRKLNNLVISCKEKKLLVQLLKKKSSKLYLEYVCSEVVKDSLITLLNRKDKFNSYKLNVTNNPKSILKKNDSTKLINNNDKNLLYSENFNFKFLGLDGKKLTRSMKNKLDGCKPNLKKE